MSESPPAKRQRTDAPLTRSKIWYKDGSVVLQAENTQFRVHWGVLSENSTFFAGLEGLPQPSDQLTVDGCSLVELLDDAVVDVEYLLKALYTPTFLLQKALPFAVVAALIRLGRKYDFRDLLDTAVERLMFENPTALESYDALLTVDDTYQTTRILDQSSILYDMLTLARENNIQSALPCAYYRILCIYDQRHVFEGIDLGDGTRASLAPVDQIRCVLGREAILKVQSQSGYTAGWLSSGNEDDCTDPTKCTRTRVHGLQRYGQTLPLFALTRLTLGATSFCPSCEKHVKESWPAGRKKVWEELPKFFDLPPWDQLTNDL
ncbi:hypothetical protein B0H14DRAFT_2714918 [Mycena olivaceomarginata]|nr:hypothetical protein B0H14DRAFT_2714918 [Mycena olivaceomarginata]